MRICRKEGVAQVTRRLGWGGVFVREIISERGIDLKSICDFDAVRNAFFKVLIVPLPK